MAGGAAWKTSDLMQYPRPKYIGEIGDTEAEFACMILWEKSLFPWA